MSIFWRIFLGYSLAMTILLAFAFSASDFWAPRHWGGPHWKPEAYTMAVCDAVQVYEQKGANAFAQEVKGKLHMGEGIFLFGATGHALVSSGETGIMWEPLAAATLRDRTPQIARLNMKIGMAMPFDSSSGQHYVVVMVSMQPVHERYRRPQFWAKMAASLVPAILICLALTLYITHPLSALRDTANRIASGDLTARPPEAQKRRRDELGELSRDLDVMVQRLESLLAAQRRFVASVSHELGAPITRVHLALTLLQKEFASGMPESLRQIEREADRLGLLVQELLYLASLEKGSIPNETFARVSLDSLCREVLRDNTVEIEERRCDVVFTSEEIAIDAAPQALRRAIENIFRNALQHTPQHSSVHFSCSLSRSADVAVIEVSDSGCGVPPLMLDAIFEPFVRVTRPMTTSEGTGLGLTIAADAVALHGGRVEALNRDDGVKGLIVRIHLPLR